MASQWSISRDGEDVGTATTAELRAMARNGTLLPTDHLWKDGMQDWQLAGDFPELFPDSETAAVVLPPEEGESPSIMIDVNRSTSRRNTASVHPKPTSRVSRRLHTPPPEVILGFPAEQWMAWFPWAMLFASIGSVLLVIAMRITVLLPAFLMRGIRLPHGISGRPTVEEPLLWKFVFFLSVAQAVAGPVAFPMLRSRKPAGWAIAFGSAIAWMLYETLELVARPAFSLFVLLPLVSAVAVAFALWQLRSRYGLKEGIRLSSDSRGAAPHSRLVLPQADELQVGGDETPHSDTAEQIWPSVPGSIGSFSATTVTRARTAATETAKKAMTSLRSAGRVIAKQAESTRIQAVTLPHAYAELGKAIYQDGTRREEFADLFAVAAELLARRKQIHEQAKATPAGDSLADKAIKSVADAAALARMKAIDLEAYQAFVRLGEAVYRLHGSESGPTEVVEPIAAALAHRVQIGDEKAATDVGSPLTVDIRATSRKTTKAVKTHAKTVGRVATLTAERTKISTVTLPLAYRGLGEHCYRSRTHAEAFPELFAKLDAIQAGQADEGEPGGADGGDTIAATAMAWAEQGMTFARSQAQGVHAKALFVQLGKACFDQFGPESGPEELVSKVKALKERLSSINTEVASRVKDAGGTKTLLIYGGGALLSLCILFAFFGGGGSGGSHGGDAQNNLVGCPRGASEEFKQGWSQAIWFSRAMNSECEISSRNMKSIDPDSHASFVFARRMELEEKLRNAEESVRYSAMDDERNDMAAGWVGGYKYGLRYILKKHY